MKTLRKIYLEAAAEAEAVVAKGCPYTVLFSCNAIDRAAGGMRHSVPRKLYRKVMGFVDKSDGGIDPFIVAIGEATGHKVQESNKLRAWMLCMMAACCDDMVEAE